MTQTATQSLDNIPLLAELTPAERDELARLCRWKRFQAGEQIIDSESSSRDIYFVVSGMVRVVNFSISGREVTLDDIGPGGYFGELAALDGGPRSATVIALGGAQCAALSSDHLTALLRRHPDICMAIMRGLARVIRQTTGRVMDLSTLGANNRVHAELLRQARLVSQDGRSAVISPIPIHSDIASRVSTTRETVARVLNDLAREGIVKREKDALQIPDMTRLQELVEDVRGM